MNIFKFDKNIIKIELLFIRLLSLFIFHLISDIIFPLYKNKIAPLQQWYWMMDECNYILSLISKEDIKTPDRKKYLET